MIDIITVKISFKSHKHIPDELKEKIKKIISTLSKEAALGISDILIEEKIYSLEWGL